MITNYLEITQLNGSRNLIPIESVEAVTEFTRDIETMVDGKPTIIKQKACKVLVLGQTFIAMESYDNIKQQINKIGAALRRKDQTNE